MKGRISAILLCVLLFLCALPSAAQVAAADRWLSLCRNTSGARYLVDARGNTVRLIGPDIRQADLGEDQSVAALAEQWRAQGANAVRLCLDVTATGQDKMELCGGYTEEGMNAYISQYVDPDVQAILDAGLYVVLTLSEMPTATKLSNILQYASEKYLPLWVQIVTRYKNEPMIAAFDLWDEPTIGLQDDEKGRQTLAQFFIDSVDTLRLYDERHVFIVSDWNGGYGTAHASQWQTQADAVDASAKNTAFSVHAEGDTFGRAYTYYGPWWNNTAVEKNLCLFFGRIRVPEEGLNDTAQQNLLQLLADPTNCSLFFSCPNGIPLMPVWVEGAARLTKQLDDRRFVFEAEEQAQAEYLHLAQPVGAFGDTLYFDDTAQDRCVVLDTGYLFPNGLYEVRVRFCGTEDGCAAVQVGYVTPSGTVVTLGTVSGVTDGFDEQSLTLHIDAPFTDLVLWRAADGQGDTVQIDRIVLRSEGAVLPQNRNETNATTLADGASAIVTTVATPPVGGSSTRGWKIALAVCGGVFLLLVLIIAWLLFLGRHYDQPKSSEKEVDSHENTSR